MDIKISLKNTDITRTEIDEKKQPANSALDSLWSGRLDMTGWVQAPLKQDKEELDYILNVADIVKSEAELMVVIGIGGSYRAPRRR